jgi:pyruvate-ferredoxin/flavodoxin oxidoreductase
MGPVQKAIDGNEATAMVAYAMSDVSFIYPITPSTPMGELSDVWSHEGRKNIFGNVMQVTQMESETGAAGALHGALAAGALATTFTCSQGLLLMIPNMYKIAGELIPCVLHVTARALAGQGLSIFGDHQDVMAVRQAGWSMLCSHSVQECADMALISHLATLKASVPFVHFFDGFRTSHEVSKITTLDMAKVQELVSKYQDKIDAHRARALNPNHPHQRGTSQGPDIYFQMLEAANSFYEAVPALVEETMREVAAITGRKYGLFDYYGAPDAQEVVVAMGSGCSALEEAADYLNARGRKVGVLKVHLYRPWSAEHFLSALPPSAQRIAVLDRTKENGALGEPLFLDVAATLRRHGRATAQLVGGRYGLGGKDFTPTMARAVYDNLASESPVDGFTVGLYDDVTFKSLPLGPKITTLPEGTSSCLFWGMGSDGTVGANKEAVKIIGGQEGMYAQAYFSYDAHKSGGVTISHLRFGPQPISSSYLIDAADYLAVGQQAYLAKYDVLSALRPGGTLVLNATWRDVDAMGRALPQHVRRQLAQLQPRLYVIDANAVAEAVGLGKRVNMVMQTVFFELSQVLPVEKAKALLKQSITKAYSKKGDAVVAMNHRAVDAAVDALQEFHIPAHWGDHDQQALNSAAAAAAAVGATSPSEFLERVVRPMLAMEGDKLPVSVFTPGGFMPPGTTAIEKRSIASTVPVWQADACTQCNLCSFICPHAAIRPSLATADELARAPQGFEAVPVKGGKALQDYKYRMQVSPTDCTGCALCINACPDNALIAETVAEVVDREGENWDFFKTLPVRGDLFDRHTMRGSQFQQPLMEFSGACEGCGETPYVKLLTQLFGERMIVANATGCSSIWGGSAPANPYTVNARGQGPAWANSLFEDNAQFGFGIYMGTKQRRAVLATDVEAALNSVVGSEQLRAALREWLAVRDNGALAGTATDAVLPLLEAEALAVGAPGTLTSLWSQRDLFNKPSVWIVGGDGWAYDIGFGGLDHVFSTGENVNILVLDTEMYSNTGGQKSKSTPLGAVVKFASGGKSRPKKDLAMLAMQSYPDVYVASVCLEANYNQVLKAMSEAEAHNGVSLVVAYSPCAMHGICDGMECGVEEAHMAVESNYWPLYRYNPSAQTTDAEGVPLHRGKLLIDSKRAKADLAEFLHRENRFEVLHRSNPETAQKLREQLAENNGLRAEKLKRMAERGV